MFNGGERNMKKTLFDGALALPNGNAESCIKAICRNAKVMKTNILAKWISLHTPSLGNQIPAAFIKKSIFNEKVLGFAIG
jgi:hypothetical protein